MNSKRRRVSGFSLIESLFAVFLVAICATIIAATVPLANNNRARADMMNQALQIAQKELEAARYETYANLTVQRLKDDGLLDSTTPNGSLEYPFHNVDNGAFGSAAQILPQGKGWLKIEQPAADLRKITVRVAWVDRGNAREVTLSTLVGNL